MGRLEFLESPACIKEAVTSRSYPQFRLLTAKEGSIFKTKHISKTHTKNVSGQAKPLQCKYQSEPPIHTPPNKKYGTRINRN